MAWERTALRLQSKQLWTRRSWSLTQAACLKTWHAIHINGGHCKARTFLNRVKAQFGKSVPERLVQLYVECCPQCTVQKPRKTVTAGHKPILTKGFGARGQVDLIDFQSCPDGSFKYLLNYQDHGIKLYDNRALTSKRTEAIAFALLDIFTLIGAPAILQTDNGREFSGAAGKGVALRDEVRTYADS